MKKIPLILISLFLFWGFANSSEKAQSGTRTIILEPGWNLVTLPLSESITPASFVNSYPLIRSIWHLNKNNNSWERFPDVDSISSLSTLVPNEGYWVQTNYSIQIEGPDVAITSFEFEKHWNLMGTNHSEGLATVESFFDKGHFWQRGCSLAETVESVWAWNNQNWEVYFTGASDPRLASLTHIKKGAALMVKTKMGNQIASNQTDPCEPAQLNTVALSPPQESLLIGTLIIRLNGFNLPTHNNLTATLYNGDEPIDCGNFTSRSTSSPTSNVYYLNGAVACFVVNSAISRITFNQTLEEGTDVTLIINSGGNLEDLEDLRTDRM